MVAYTSLLDDFCLFVEIAKRGSYSKASTDLSISTSKLSKRIKALESHLGQTLFIRSARGLFLTGFGRSLYEAEGQALLSINARLQNASAQQQRYFIVHCPQNLMSASLYKGLKEFLVSTVQEDISIIVEPSNTVLSLSQRSFDVAIRVGPQSDSSFFHKRIATIGVAIVKVPDLSSSDVLIVPYKAQQIGEKTMATIEKDFKRLLFVHDITVARQLVADGLGWGLLPMTEAHLLYAQIQRELVYHTDILFKRDVYVVWPGTRKPNPITRRFISFMEDVVKETPHLQGKLV